FSARWASLRSLYSAVLSTLSLHDALPISPVARRAGHRRGDLGRPRGESRITPLARLSRRHRLLDGGVRPLGLGMAKAAPRQVDEDRKSTRLNSSHVKKSYAVLRLKKEKNE